MLVAALRFVYGVTLNRPDVMVRIPYPRVPRKQPVVLSKGEVLRVLEAISSIKYRAIITAAYAAGLRISEACSLHATSIDRSRGLLLVRGGKGGKDRTVMLSATLLALLETYWWAERPGDEYLFPGKAPGSVVAACSVRNALRVATAAARIFNKRVTPHTFRHSFATHLIEDGVDISVVQELLGHRSVRTTRQYIHISTRHVAAVSSPLDTLHGSKS